MDAEIRANPGDQWWWRFMFGFPIITALIRSFCLLTFFRFDTLAYLISHGKDEDAKEIIKYLYFEEHVKDIYSEIKSKMTNHKNVSYQELFGRTYRSRVFMGILLSLIQQFSGVNAVLFYSDKILKGDVDSDQVSDFDADVAKIFTILIGCILIFSSWLSGKFIDKFGRKSILLLGEVLCSITLALLSVLGFLDLYTPSKYIILVYMLSFGISLGPIVWLYLPEILPEKGVSLAASANWVGCGIIGIGFPIVKNAINIEGTFLIFLVCCLVALVYMFFCVKETKGKSHEEIEAMFDEVVKNGEKKLLNADHSSEITAILN